MVNFREVCAYVGACVIFRGDGPSYFWDKCHDGCGMLVHVQPVL